MATPLGRRGGSTASLLIATAVALIATACSASSHQATVPWTAIPAAGLVPAAASTPFTPAVAAAPSGGGWLLGGVVLGPNGSRAVAIWSSPGLSGPWTRAVMDPVPGRDGPNETIFGIIGDRAHLVAFGYRRSPTEGYPRPSTWLTASPAGGTWQEILEDREFFGGPDIIGFGGLAVGPHGYSVAGTWTDARGHPVVAVWRSPDGSTWSRDSTDPSFEGVPGEIPFASAIADSASGLLLVGTNETPTAGNPLRRQGGIWFSRSGQSWTRVGAGGASLPSEGSTFAAVAATSAGWVIAGREEVHGRWRPVVWLVDNHLRVSPPLALPEPPGAPVQPASMAVSGAALIVAGAAGHRGVLWVARLRAGVPRGWKALTSPPDTAFPLTSVSVAASRNGLVVSLIGSDRSELWTARPGAGLALLRD